MVESEYSMGDKMEETAHCVNGNDERIPHQWRPLLNGQFGEWVPRYPQWQHCGAL